PYQGAATGVGGILRDVFTMGARPVALLNSLRFGPLDEARNRYLCAGAVRGVGDYGNCVGVPTLGGEVDFGPGYSGNPLVNAMCVGLLREQDLITAAAHGVGNALLVLGSRTGRDGIHGASFASEELTQESERRRPQVQVGDPFTEKLLLEASLELIASGHIVAIQDMGAAGLTSSSAEMAARGGVGVEIDLARVPTREPGMTPYEILLSESQERMLVVAKAERLPQIQAIAAKWEITATPIGRVTDDGMYRATWKQRVVVEIPGQRLIEDCPVESPAAEEDPAIRRRRGRRPSGSAVCGPSAARQARPCFTSFARRAGVSRTRVGRSTRPSRAATCRSTTRAPPAPWTRLRSSAWSAWSAASTVRSRAMRGRAGTWCFSWGRPTPSSGGQCCGKRCTASWRARHRAWTSRSNAGSSTFWPPVRSAPCSAPLTTAHRAGSASRSRRWPWAARTTRR